MGDWASGQLLPDIPRIYTAVAEWLACVVCILQLRHRFSAWRLRGIAAAALLVQSVFLVVTDGEDGALWMLCMVCAFLFMYLFIYASCDISMRDAAYNCIMAFVLAEFAASLEWQLHCFCYYGSSAENVPPWMAYLLLVAVYGAVYYLMWSLSGRFVPETEKLDIRGREVVFAVIIGVSVFLISNVGFVYSNTPFSVHYSADIFNVRTLVDLGGLAILYAYHIQRLHLRAQHELESMEMILHNQYTQYQQSKETLEIINYKYHDLKHHIHALRAEENAEKRKEYLDAMEEDIKSYGARRDTGNAVLDTLLTSKSITCQQNGIELTVVADGALLDFMDTMDICSIFGNAMDNAIECELGIPDREKRMIHVSVFSRMAFLIIRFENYCENRVKFESRLPVTTKQDSQFHGYGLKSLRRTVHKYGGEVDISSEDSWFELKILIPMEIQDTGDM